MSRDRRDNVTEDTLDARNRLVRNDSFFYSDHSYNDVRHRLLYRREAAELALATSVVGGSLWCTGDRTAPGGGSVVDR